MSVMEVVDGDACCCCFRGRQSALLDPRGLIEIACIVFPRMMIGASILRLYESYVYVTIIFLQTY
jgi:hypothetical protein